MSFEHIKIKKPEYPYKYKVIIKPELWNVYREDKISKPKTIRFGHRDYQHYYDKLGDWKKLNHLDEKRRQKYRKRHSRIKTKDNKRAIDKIFSPAWFSYNFLW